MQRKSVSFLGEQLPGHVVRSPKKKFHVLSNALGPTGRSGEAGLQKASYSISLCQAFWMAPTLG